MKIKNKTTEKEHEISLKDIKGFSLKTGLRVMVDGKIIKVPSEAVFVK